MLGSKPRAQTNKQLKFTSKATLQYIESILTQNISLRELLLGENKDIPKRQGSATEIPCVSNVKEEVI